MDGWIDGSVSSWVDRWTHGNIIDTCIYGKEIGWMSRWMSEWVVDRWMDG